MGLPQKFNTWINVEEYGRDWCIHGCHIHHETWEQLLEMLHHDGSCTCQFRPEWSDYTPVWPTRCGTNGFFHFSICCSNCLGWYWGWQRTSWIRKTVTVFSLLKKFHTCNFHGYWQPWKWFNSENYPIYGTLWIIHVALCYYHNVHPLSWPIRSPQSNKYVQQWDHTWAMPTIENESTAEMPCEHSPAQCYNLNAQKLVICQSSSPCHHW